MRITKQLIERYTIISKEGEEKEASKFFIENKLRLVWAGPKPIGNGLYDSTKRKCVADKYGVKTVVKK